MTCGSPPHRRSAKAAAQPKPTGFATGTATAAVELLDEAVGAIEGAGGAAGAALKPIGSSNIWARSEGSGGGAASCAVGAADGAVRVGGGVGVAGSDGWNCPGTTAVVGAGGRHGAEVGAQARVPPWPLAGSGVNPALYLAFSASGSAFQRWPGAWPGAGERARGKGERSQRMGQGQGGEHGAREGAVVAEL